MRKWGFLVSMTLILPLLAGVDGWCQPIREAAVVPSSPAPVVGRNQFYALQPGDTLVDLALREGLGYLSLTAANPGVDPWLPPAGGTIVLPLAAVLPAAAGLGITVNVAEFRLYYLWQEKGKRRVLVYPIGTGTEGWETPLGNFSVLRKVSNPSWTAPLSIRRERPDEPAFVPPGPDNPLGDFWMQVTTEGHGIHGTNKPLGVGRRISHGCIRLYPDHIRDLFRRVAVATPVRILYQPIKLGLNDDRLVMEVHTDFLGLLENPLAEVVRQKKALKWQGRIDLTRLLTVLREARGIPETISEGPEVTSRSGTPEG